MMLLISSITVFGQSPKAKKPTPQYKDPLDRKVDSVLAKMNLDEKIGQLTLFTSDWDVTGPTIRKGYADDIRSGKCGNIFNAHTADYNRKLQEIAMKETRMKIPLLFGYDVIHGYKTIFPIPLGEAASWDMTAIERSARIAAEEASAAGLHWTFAPMLDISRDPRWGRCTEGSGEDVYLGSLIGAARTRGFQGKIGSTSSVVACAKHFAAYGAAQAGRDYHTVDLSDVSLWETYLPPFKACVDAGALTFMTSFNEINGVPSTANKPLLTDILRKKWGFKGFIVTDYTSINEMVNHGNVADEKEAGEKSINAGVDMDLQGAVYYNYLKKSLAEGKVSQLTVDNAVRRVLKLKFQLGLFDNPYKFSDTEREKRVVFSKENREAARDMARKSIVLLKNDNMTLPLSKNKTIAVVGPLADSKIDLIGSWSGAGDGNACVSLLEGIKKAAPSATIMHAQGCDLENNFPSMNQPKLSMDGFAEAIRITKQADVVVVAVGERGWMTGEAACRADITLPGVQKDLILELVKTGKPVVVVLLNGRPLAIPEVADKATAIVEAWFPGTEGGNAVADVLFGDYNPSGKLPMTFPRSVGQVPLFYCEKNTGRPFDANNKYTSKYMDMANTPQYPFGFGLSYTTFSYENLSADKPMFGFNDKITVSFTLKNTGNRDGEEIAQLYVRDLVGSITRPLKELKRFQKVLLKAGESKVISFTLTTDDLAFYHPNLEKKAEAGDFDIMVGGSSDAVKTVRVTLK
ncbi:MAG: beta-glucosidase BglX [Saprospiraceae bacterium]|nr:beta-glucosidase BglX [Saprospiraceae bacterium]